MKGARPGVGAGARNQPPAAKKNTLAEIQRLEREREERRKAQQQAKADRSAEEQRNIDNGTPGDVDFQRMINQFRANAPPELRHANPGAMKICVCVRKRPVSTKEIERKDYDSVSCGNPVVTVHYCKLKVDGISKYLENNPFEFDHVFGDDDTTDDLYYYAVQPLIDFVIGGGRATVFAYGQTGSGKTYTMTGVQQFVAEDLFSGLAVAAEENEANNSVIKSIEVYVTFFEIYGGRCQDLLNQRNKLVIREDGNGEVNIADLLEVQVRSAEEMLSVIGTGNTNRTTHATESNEESSRSHAICQIILRKVDGKGRSKVLGKMSLIDLAGSERGADTKSHNRTRRMEGAEINKSLLALKECVRALDSNSGHVPYRASKLTLVLKDSFTKNSSRTVMVVNVSPAASSADHTLNTLRYADRIKETHVGNAAAKFNAAGIGGAAGGGGDEMQGAGSRDRSPPRQAAAGAVAAGRGGAGAGAGVASSAAGGAKAGGGSNNNARAGAGHPPLPQGKFGHQGDVTPPPPAPGQGRGFSDPAGGGGGAAGAKAGGRGGGGGGFEDDLDIADDMGDPGDDSYAFGETAEEQELNRTIQGLFDEEEELLNMHMNNIQENAELLTEEGKLLQQLQSDDNNDIDIYTNRLDAILTRKLTLIRGLQDKLATFKVHLQEEEKVSKRLAAINSNK